MPPNNPVRTSLTFELPAHSCVAKSPRTTSRTNESSSEPSLCPSNPIFIEPAFETRPESGASIPAITLISVLLPPPFLPTIPIRSPAFTPSETPSNNARISKDFETDSRFNKLVTAIVQGYLTIATVGKWM